MNNTIAFVAGVIIGGAAGVLGARQYFKKKYEDIAQEEIDSVKEAFSRKEKKDESEDSDSADDDESELEEAKTVMKDNGYFDEDVDVYKMKKSDEAPYVINDDEFGNMETEGYEMETLYYYLDGTLADGDDNRVDLDDLIGADALNHFDEYVQDTVYVRNEKYRTDYEVLLMQRSFADVVRASRYRGDGGLDDEE
jgi:gas vesicle protein